MSINIMLSFLSNYHLVNNRTTVSSYYGGNSEIKGEHTNEAALRYVHENYKLTKYFCFCSKMVRADVKYIDENNVERNITHYNLFKERLRRHIPNIDEIIEYVDYNEADLSSESIGETNDDNAADLAAVKEMANAVIKFASPYLNAGTEVVLYLDTTGGFRHANTLMLAVVELLKYSGITIGNILYSNYNKSNKDRNGNIVPIGKIEDITDIHSVMQLAAGAEAFIVYGKVDVLRRYFNKYSSSKALEKLLKAMESFSDALSLCRSGMLVEAATGLRRAMDNFRKSNCRGLHEVLFQELLLQRIEKEYKLIGDGSDRLSIIRWCLEKGFLQQAMTLYTEWVPDIIVEKKIFYPIYDGIKNLCKQNAYTPWAKTFLSHYSYNEKQYLGAQCLNKNNEILGQFAKYALLGSSMGNALMSGVSDEERDYVKKIGAELEQNDKIVAMLKNKQITIKEVEINYPKLYFLIHSMYYINPNCMPKVNLQEHWIKKINTKKLHEFIRTAPKKIINELICQKKDDGDERPKHVNINVAQIPGVKYHQRWKYLKKMLEYGVAKTAVEPELALQICDEYNTIRDLRNHINHANEDVIDAGKLKEQIEIYLYNLESVVNKIE